MVLAIWIGGIGATVLATIWLFAYEKPWKYWRKKGD